MQCRDGVGACPDELDSSGTCQNDIFDISGYIENAIQCVSYSKNFSTGELRRLCASTASNLAINLQLCK